MWNGLNNGELTSSKLIMLLKVKNDVNNGRLTSTESIMLSMVKNDVNNGGLTSTKSIMEFRLYIVSRKVEWSK